MDPESWLICWETAVLQGGFLLAEKLSQPKLLSTLEKGEWAHVAQPVLRALEEVCGPASAPFQDQSHWRKKLICVLWSKLLGTENREDVDTRWQENSLFALQDAFPHINRAVLFDLVQSMRCFRVYADLLWCFPPHGLASELSMLLTHIVQDEGTVENLMFLLEVWRELCKGPQTERHTVDRDFAIQCNNYANPSPDLVPQPPKRLKTDPDAHLSASCIPSQLFLALTKMESHTNTPELCCFALTNCLDMLHTLFLLDHAPNTHNRLDLQDLTWEVTQREGINSPAYGSLAEVIQEAQRDLRAGQNPCPFRPHGMSLVEALRFTCGLAQSWGSKGLLKPLNPPSSASLCLKRSLRRVISAVKDLLASDRIPEKEKQDVLDLQQQLGNMDVLSAHGPTCSAAEEVRVAVAIIDHRLDGFENVAVRFVSELDWASTGTEWIGCLERNKDVFQHNGLLLKLLSTLAVRCQFDDDVHQCRQLMSIIVDTFSNLPLSCQNNVLVGVLASWGKAGLYGFLPQSMSEGFTKELNLAFNSIIQSGNEGDLSQAIPAVARVAFQNPEAALRRCCHLAVVNSGTHVLLGRVLWQLPGLRYQLPQDRQGAREDKPTESLICKCLQDAVWGRLSSAKEEEQFLQFLVILMEPPVGQDTEVGGLLAPAEVLHAFVLPQLSPPLLTACGLELCLKVLLAALRLEPQAGQTHWVLCCSPVPLLFTLCLLLDRSCRCWEEPAEGALHISMESKELLITAVGMLGELVGQDVAARPESWSRPVSWLYSRAEALDWTVRLRLRPVWGAHFKREVPCSLLDVCDLPEQEWSGVELAQYGQGTGLLAWAECCCLSDALQGVLLGRLAVDQSSPEAVTMFSKGILLVLTQVLPWCTAEEWLRVLAVLRSLLASDQLHVPYSLEYVDYLPLLDLRQVAADLQLSILLLRVFQMLCSAVCAPWLAAGGREHAGLLYASAARSIVAGLVEKLSVPEAEGRHTGAEVLFALTQVFCHVVHVQVMLRSQAQPIFLCGLEIVAQCQAVLETHPGSSSARQRDDMRHFLTSISDNVECADMRTALRQKIAQL